MVENRELFYKDLVRQYEELQRKYDHVSRALGSSKSATRGALRLVVGFERFFEEMIERLVEDGIHPLTLEYKGRYAYFNRGDILVAMSVKASDVFGYKPGDVNLEKVVDREDLSNFIGLREERTVDSLNVNIVEGKTLIRDVNVMPIWIKDNKNQGLYMGSVVDFKTLSYVGRFRNLLMHKKLKTTEDAEAKKHFWEVWNLWRRIKNHKEKKQD
jgi:hypothetical protein